jgi:hypothetical protein
MNQTNYPEPRWYDYLAAMLIPPWAIIAGIITMARSQVGPGFALWAIGTLGFWVVWPALLLIIGAIASAG